jgi:hypothetical protein
MYCVGGARAVGVRIWTGGHFLAFKSLFVLCEVKHSPQTRIIIICCVINTLHLFGCCCNDAHKTEGHFHRDRTS